MLETSSDPDLRKDIREQQQDEAAAARYRKAARSIAKVLDRQAWDVAGDDPSRPETVALRARRRAASLDLAGQVLALALHHACDHDHVYTPLSQLTHDIGRALASAKAEVQA
jgi:hypothetical protein